MNGYTMNAVAACGVSMGSSLLAKVRSNGANTEDNCVWTVPRARSFPLLFPQ